MPPFRSSRGRLKVLEDAIEKVRPLPEERQRYVARVLEQLSDNDDTVYQLPDEESRLVQEGIDAADSGRVISEEDMETFWTRHRA